VVRRKLFANPLEKTFDGNVIIATPQDPTRTYDDPVLTDSNLYLYRVFRRALLESIGFYHVDHLNTPIAMTGSGAAFVWRAELLPFGGVQSLSVTNTSNNLRFPSQYHDDETGNEQNWFRSYSPRTGRYTQPDPLPLDFDS